MQRIMRQTITASALLAASGSAAWAQAEHPPSDTAVAFDNSLSLLSQSAEGLANGELGNSLGLAGEAVSSFATTAVTDTTDSINPGGGVDLVEQLGDFGAGQAPEDGMEVGDMATLPGL